MSTIKERWQGCLKAVRNGADFMRNLLKNAAASLFILSLLVVQGCQQASQPQSKPANVSTSGNTGNGDSQQASAPQTQLKVGDTAPDFTLTDTNGQPVKLSDFRGKKNVTLAFYVLAFTGG
jgi:cytochrome oxidase Cu insertion factor (SCO1/SenC/PrrC family)